MQVYITSRNLLCAADLACQLADQRGVHSLTVIDCGSTYQPLFRRYAKLPRCISLEFAPNLGCRAAWERFKPTVPYVVTDGDLSIEGWPPDGLLQLREIAESRPEFIKVGAALSLDGLPNNEITRQVREHESQFWAKPIDGNLYAADIDTTLAVYTVPTWGGYGPSIRHGGLQAKHLPWYINPLNPPDDYRHNLMTRDHIPCTHWTDKLRAIYQP